MSNEMLWVIDQERPSAELIGILSQKQIQHVWFSHAETTLDKREQTAPRWCLVNIPLTVDTGEQLKAFCTQYPKCMVMVYGWENEINSWLNFENVVFASNQKSFTQTAAVWLEELKNQILKQENKYLRQALELAEAHNKALDSHTQHITALKVADLKRDNQRLQQIQYLDDITKLYNNRYLSALLKAQVPQALEKKQPLSLLMLDLDDFKLVNDAYNHDFGTLVLNRVARLIEKFCGDKNPVIRYDGDCFVVVLKQMQLSQAQNFAHALCEQLASSNVGSNKEPWFATASIGVTEVNTCKATTAQTLLQVVDYGLLQAKQNGRNCVVTVCETPRLTGTAFEKSTRQQLDKYGQNTAVLAHERSPN